VTTAEKSQLTIAASDFWGDAALRRYYGRQAVREARKATRGDGPVYASATPEERAATAAYLRQIATLHYSIANTIP
jgi:hypothetical protein